MPFLHQFEREFVTVSTGCVRTVSSGFAVLVVGKTMLSAVYVRNKIRACEDAGIRSFRLDFDETSSPDAVLSGRSMI